MLLTPLTSGVDRMLAEVNHGCEWRTEEKKSRRAAGSAVKNNRIIPSFISSVKEGSVLQCKTFLNKKPTKIKEKGTPRLDS